MSSHIEIPADLQPAIEAAIVRGEYANEQELVSDILRVAVPALAEYQRLRRDIQASLVQVDDGEIHEADFSAIRDRLLGEFDESGKPK